VTGTQRTVSGLAILFLIGAAFFGFLNSQKMKALRTTATNAEAAREAAGSEQQDKTLEERAVKAEAALAQVQKEKADLQATLDAKQQEIASLQKPVEEADKNSNAAGTASPAAPDLQSQIDDLRRQLDSAEKEKGFLAAKLQDAQERGAPTKETKKHREQGAQRETASPQHETAPAHRTGVRGTVLAYNQAYNFVVLNLGARNGVETNAEMLVLRDGTLIGKIRISSVEPATAIGDILTNSLARGVQVQPGDTVIYAGTNP
jgi:FtsZ-interacting cell division protein ZipA